VRRRSPPEPSDRGKAAIDLIRRTSARQFELRYSDDGVPVVFMAIATFDSARGKIYEVDASLDPERAVLRLAERLIDGGICVHCQRPAGLDPDSLDSMPDEQDDLLVPVRPWSQAIRERMRLMPKIVTDPELGMLREIMVKLGRAISLSVVAGVAGPRIEDHAIQSADEAWRDLADAVYALAKD
jgi:hypothetical protein